MKILYHASAVLSCAAALASAALAAEPAKPAPTKPAAAKPAASPAPREAGFGARSSGPLLTREELRACLSLQERVRAMTEEAGRVRTDLDARKAELLASAEALKAELASVDRTSQEAVDAYNARSVARDERVAAYEQAVAAFNARVDALAADRDTFTGKCNNRRYDEADEIALRSGR